MARIRTLLLCLLAGALCAVPAADAKIHVAIGMGDQNAAMFSQPKFRALHIKRVRYFIRWDAIRHKDLIAYTDAYVAAARKAHAKVLMHISTDDYRPRKGKLPSARKYKKLVGKLVRRYHRKGVVEWGVWNEANHISEPTWKNPKRAAQYFHAMRQVCKRCKIVALDLLDQSNTASYIKRWFRALKRSDRRAVKIVGIHNYADTNRYRVTGTKRIIQRVRRYNKRTQYWLTETGGIVKLQSGWKCSPKRAAKAIGYMFKVAKKYRRYVKRLYNYSFFGEQPSCQHHDYGLVTYDGKARKGYRVFKKQARRFTRS